MGQGIWCSPGMSSSYLITTDNGRVVVNTGMWFEARTHKRNYDAVSTAPTRYITLTQSHTDHIGGVDRFREDGTLLIAQGNITACQADDERIHGLRIRRSLPFFSDVMGQPGFARGDDVELPPLAKPAEPDVVFDDAYQFECGERRLECISVPGGETIDSLVVWLPDDGVALVGNLFSALFGHFPNLVTMRGDRMRSALAFAGSVQKVIDLRPELLLLGHHGPVRGEATVRSECERVRDAVLYVHDATVAAMNAGKDVWTAMHEIALPEHLAVGEGYGRVDWSIRAIWETYAGWFHQHSTLELVDFIRIDDLRAPRLDAGQQAALDYVATLDLDLSEERLLDEARGRAQCHDFGDLGFLDRLRAVIDAVEADTGLGPLGRLAIRQRTVRLLTSRLLVEDLVRRRPEILDIELVTPIIVIGLPRSGTTHLVNLIASDTRLRSLPYWESLQPVPLPGDGPARNGTDPRFERCRRDYDAQMQMVPLDRKSV